jgi:DNA-binding MarR family transcriptional regulator
MAPSGLRVTQFSLLRTISSSGTCRLTDLAETLLLDRTALSRTLDPLAERGFVTIIPGRDARTREVSLTRAGERAVKAALPHWEHAQTEVARTIGAEKLQALIATLRDIEALHPDPGGRGR